MLFHSRNFSVARLWEIDKETRRSLPKMRISAQDSISHRIWLVWNYPFLRTTPAEGLQANIGYHQEEIILKLNAKTSLRLCTSSGEGMTPQSRLEINNFYFRRFGLFMGAQNGAFVSHQFDHTSGWFCRVSNKYFIENDGKCSMSLGKRESGRVKLKWAQRGLEGSLLIAPKASLPPIIKNLSVKLCLDQTGRKRMEVQWRRSETPQFCFSDISALQANPYIDGHLLTQLAPHMTGTVTPNLAFDIPTREWAYFELSGLASARVGIKQSLGLYKGFGLSWGSELTSNPEFVPFVGLYYNDVEMLFPFGELVNLHEDRSDWVKSACLRVGFSISQCLLAWAVKVAAKHLSLYVSFKTRKKLFDEILQAKSKVDTILKQNMGILNRSGRKMRVFVVFADQMEFLSNLVEHFEDFMREEIEKNEICVEITKSYLFYTYILGYFPAKKKGLIGYLEPVRRRAGDLQIAVFERHNNGALTKHRIFGLGERVLA